MGLLYFGKTEMSRKIFGKGKSLTSVLPYRIMDRKGAVMMSNSKNRETMARNIRRQMDAAGVKPKDVCDALQIPMPTFSDWIHGKTYPRIDKIERMAEYFGVSKSALVEEASSAPSPEEIQEIEFTLEVKDGYTTADESKLTIQYGK